MIKEELQELFAKLSKRSSNFRVLTIQNTEQSTLSTIMKTPEIKILLVLL